MKEIKLISGDYLKVDWLTIGLKFIETKVENKRTLIPTTSVVWVKELD